MALSLSVDTLVVSMCGGVSLGRITAGKVLKVASAFAVMQTALLSAGWLFGNSIVRYIESIAGVVGFLLLLYIGVNMIRGALKKESDDHVDLSGIRNLLLAAVATSIDAAAVGVSLAMAELDKTSIVLSVASVFTVTAAAAVAGIAAGNGRGSRNCRKAQRTDPQINGNPAEASRECGACPCRKMPRKQHLGMVAGLQAEHGDSPVAVPANPQRLRNLRR